jgi:3-phenylpropionate/trans-cinnamate dioxygenase ferredoxin subunit
VGDQVVCPRHGARFCLRTGRALTPPAYAAVQTFPVRISNGRVQIELPD